MASASAVMTLDLLDASWRVYPTRVGVEVTINGSDPLELTSQEATDLSVALIKCVGRHLTSHQPQAVAE